MDFLNLNVASNHIITSIGNTLVQSLWQGAILALIVWMIINFTHNSTSARRYNLLVTAMALFALGTLCTFILELNHLSALYHFIKLQYRLPVLVSSIDWAANCFNKNLSIVFYIWFLIVWLRIFQFIHGLHSVANFRNKAVFPVNAAWEKRINELALKSGISRMVSIAESGLAKVPMVIGHIKPLILIPIGLLTALKPEEVEAIVVHELAHIYRKDYLVNLLQSILEIFFFFNPAILWLSSLIRLERENCCDDIAVNQTRSKKNYIHALVSCQEYQLQAPLHVMALYDTRSQLKTRVNRILSGTNSSFPKKEKSIISISLVIVILIAAVWSSRNVPVNKSPQYAVVTNYHTPAINELTVYNKVTQSFETPNYPKDKLRINDFITALIENGIVDKQYRSFSFMLSDKEFILNGARQPKVVFEKIKRKYIVAGHKHWSWKWNNFSPSDLEQLQTSISITAPHTTGLQLTVNS